MGESQNKDRQRGVNKNICVGKEFQGVEASVITEGNRIEIVETDATSPYTGYSSPQKKYIYDSL